jgi:hypothetical protein
MKDLYPVTLAFLEALRDVIYSGPDLKGLEKALNS